MKAPLAVAICVSCLVSGPSANAQSVPAQGAGSTGTPPRSFLGQPAAPAPAAPGDGKVFRANDVLPEPTRENEIKPTIVLPNDAIEPWLLTRENGPFMVMAKTFRGPEADRYALALAMELRQSFGLPAYILRTKEFPGKGVIRNVPPLAPREQLQGNVNGIEKVRTFDEASVLVGNEKTLAGSEALLHKVKKIHPKCLEGMPSIFNWRSGLSTALRTTNPYIPTQDLFPGRKTKDHLLGQMNGGPHAIHNCPARYTLQVAEFSGRTMLSIGAKDASFFNTDWLKKSPLVSAADDAERLANALAKDPEIQRTGFQPYVYHDRTSSKVMIGAFNDQRDPSAVQLHQTLIKNAVSIASRCKGVVIAPANALTDLEDPNNPIRTLAKQ